MELIDEEGNLFGVVNLIDVLVVLLILSVVVAGVALVNPFSSAEKVTRYATIDLRNQPESVGSIVSEGDVLRPPRRDSVMTVTDVYVGPGEEGSASITIRVAIETVRPDPGEPIKFAGQSLRSGTAVELVAAGYTVNGTILQTDRSGRSLAVSNTTVVLEANLPNQVSESIQAGDTYRLTDRTVATVSSIRAFPTNKSGRKHVFLGVELTTLRTGNVARFGDVPVKLGAKIQIASTEYNITGSVVHMGPYSEIGSRKTFSADILVESVRPEVAESIKIGMRERLRGRTYARVTERRVTPAVVVLTSDDGNIYSREHPTLKDLHLSVKLTGQSTPSGIRFHGRELDVGDTIILDFGVVTVQAEVKKLNYG